MAMCKTRGVASIPYLEVCMLISFSMQSTGYLSLIFFPPKIPDIKSFYVLFLTNFANNENEMNSEKYCAKQGKLLSDTKEAYNNVLK